MRAVATLIVAGALALSLARAPAAAPPQDADRPLADAERELRRLEQRLRERLAAHERILRQKLAEMRARTERAWRAARPDVERALDELRKALREPPPDPDVTRT